MDNQYIEKNWEACKCDMTRAQFDGLVKLAGRAREKGWKYDGKVRKRGVVLEIELLDPNGERHWFWIGTAGDIMSAPVTMKGI